MTTPENVTPYGAIAYRIDALAAKLHRAEQYEWCRELWGICDDLVAFNLTRYPSVTDEP